MPTPVAKGLIITVSALVAAGIAVYESPQFRQWVDNSRRRIAFALHHLGDEIQPRPTSSPGQDISMTEEVGPEAEERRRVLREELQNRRAMLEEHRKRRQGSSGTFDALVDDDGNLLGAGGSGLQNNGSLANSTAVDLTASQAVQRSGKQTGSSTPMGETNAATNREGLHVAIRPPELQSAPLINYTPTSETPGMDSSVSTLDRLERARRSSSSSSHTEGHSQVIFAHPGFPDNDTGRDLRSPFSDLSELDFTSARNNERPSTPSTTGSFSQIYQSAADGMSDGTLSDLGRSTGDIATPASWSEVSSVISNEDANQRVHHGL